MNQRIKELAIQALPNIKYWNDELTKGIEAPKNRAVTVSELEKFAELIISDCCQVLQNWKGEPFPFDEDLAVSLIKENFGIKE